MVFHNPITSITSTLFLSLFFPNAIVCADVAKSVEPLIESKDVATSASHTDCAFNVPKDLKWDTSSKDGQVGAWNELKQFFLDDSQMTKWGEACSYTGFAGGEHEWANRAFQHIVATKDGKTNEQSAVSIVEQMLELNDIHKDPKKLAKYLKEESTFNHYIPKLKDDSKGNPAEGRWSETLPGEWLAKVKPTFFAKDENDSLQFVVKDKDDPLGLKRLAIINELESTVLFDSDYAKEVDELVTGGHLQDFKKTFPGLLENFKKGMEVRRSDNPRAIDIDEGAYAIIAGRIAQELESQGDTTVMELQKFWEANEIDKLVDSALKGAVNRDNPRQKREFIFRYLMILSTPSSGDEVELNQILATLETRANMYLWSESVRTKAIEYIKDKQDMLEQRQKEILEGTEYS